jgi:predicted metal-dependent peptidase
MTKISTAPEVKKKSAITAASRDTTISEERSQTLATALYLLAKTHPFYSGMLQSMSISYSHMLPTAGVTFSADNKRYECYLNPMYWCRALNQDQRIAILTHEILHLVNSHLTRVPFMKVSNHNRKLLNIGGDLAINSYIPNIPKGCSQCPSLEAQKQGQRCENELCPGHGMHAKDFFDTDKTGVKTPWQEGLTMEQYFFKLKEQYQDSNDSDEDGDGQDSQDRSGGTPREFDSHDWEANFDEKEMLEAMEDLVKRTMIKTNTSYNNLPSHIQKLMENMKTRKAELDYKKLILTAIKKSASGHDRKYTWSRKSRRFGNLAPGSREGPLPKLRIVLDTSGSISVTTLNEFLSVVDEFLKVGSRKCSLHLFSDKEYYDQPYKMGDRISQELLRKNVKMGGTCLENSMKNILKANPDLTLLLTDGCYPNIDVESWLKPGSRFPQCLFVIERQGILEHPFFTRSWQNTVKIPDDSK